jgi:DNA-binding XRE family transcriptional regulator
VLCVPIKNNASVGFFLRQSQTWPTFILNDAPRLYSKHQGRTHLHERQKMSKKPISFRERLKLARPDVVARQEQNSRKSAIALQLRMLRDARGMTQADVAQATGMTTQRIAQIESLVGPIPDIEDLQLYVDICDGDIDVVISPDDNDQPTDKPDNSLPE